MTTDLANIVLRKLVRHFKDYTKIYQIIGKVRLLIKFLLILELHCTNNLKDKKTTENDVFIVTLNRKTLYPKDFKDGQNYTILHNGQKF